MIIQVQRPHKYSFSKNPLLWRFYSSNPTEAGCMVMLYMVVTDEDGSNPKEFYTSGKPGTDGYTSFYMEDVIDSMIDYEYPGTAVINKGTNVKKVNLYYDRITAASSTPVYAALPAELDIFVIKGGIENIKNDYNNYFLNYHTPNKPFATWMPQDSFVGPDDDFYISLLFVNNFAALDSSDRQLNITAEWTDGTTNTLYTTFITGIPLYLLYHFKAGATALGIMALAAGRLLYRYKIQVVNSATPSTVYSEVYTFYVDYRLFYKNKLFHFYNSLGGIDFVRILGDTEQDYNRNFTETEKLSGTIVTGNPPDTLYNQTQINRYNSFKSDAGYRHTARQAVYIQELLMSTIIWEWINNIAKRVFILNKANKLIQNSDGKFNFPVDFRYGFSDTVFTPEDADLGIGADGNTYLAISCPVLTGLGVVDIGPGGTGYKLIEFTFNHDPNAVAYTVEFKLTGASVWTAVNQVTNPLATVEYMYAYVPVGGTYNWRVRNNCSAGNVSAFVNGANFTT